MAEDIVMPRLSDSMEEGVVLAWMKSVGDNVALGEELVEIETDKANMVYESDVAGTLLEILAGVDATVPIGEPIARIGEPGEGSGSSNGSARAEKSTAAEPEAAGQTEPESDKESKPAPKPDEGRKSIAPGASEHIRASPLAKRIARDEGVDLSGISGSGPGGRIIKEDVESAAYTGGGATTGKSDASLAGGIETAKGETSSVKLTRLQQTIARRMSEAKATAPHFYLSTEIDMSACVEARAGIKASAAEGSVIPSFNDMIVKACAIALTEFPNANGSYRDGQIEHHSRVNIGVAVAATEALVVPVVTDSDQKGLVEIATMTRELAGKVRDGSITPPELSGGTFSVSNLGMYGVSHFDAVINTPQAAILAVGAIEDRPVVRNGEIVAVKMMSVTLSCDHRILYGAEGAEFLARIRTILEQPINLAL